jgi:DinB superfamily
LACPAVLELLADVEAITAASHPWPDVPSVWKLVLHIAAWDDAVNRRMVIGKAVTLKDAQNFPPVKDKSKAASKKAIAHLKNPHSELIKTVAALPDSRPEDRVAGQK